MGESATVRQRMIDAGESLLAQRGYGITMLDVVGKASTPRGSIYYHFPGGKKELAVEVARKVGDDIERIVDSIWSKKRSPVAFLRALIDFQIEKLVNNDFGEGSPMLAVAVSVDIDAPELDDAVAAPFERWTDAVSTRLRAMGRRGDAQ